MRRRGLIVLLLPIIIVPLWLLAAKYIFIQDANSSANEILKISGSGTPEDTAKNAAQWIYKNQGKNGYSFIGNQIIARLRPFLTHRSLPAFFRTPPGAIELFLREGWCDDAARALSYVLAKENIKSKQWNFIGTKNAHSALVAKFGDQWALVDPYYGYTTLPKDVHDVAALNPFDEKSNHEFYSGYKNLIMGAQGEPLTIPVSLPTKPLALGIKDRSSADVKSALLQNGLTHTWTYVGHHYDRGWTRELIAPQDLQLQIILTEKPDTGVLRTLSPQPAVDGTKLSWNLLKDQKIISQDGLAGISLSRLNSYIGIDQIIITPEGDTP